MYRAPKDIELHRGAKQPSGAVEYDEGAAETIHGASGCVGLLARALSTLPVAMLTSRKNPCPISLDGVEALPPLDNSTVQYHYAKSPSGSNTASSAMAKAIKQAKAETGEKTWIVVTGPCTNAAALIAEEEELVRDSVAGWVVMGGAFGQSSSRTAGIGIELTVLTHFCRHPAMDARGGVQYVHVIQILNAEGSI